MIKHRIHIANFLFWIFLFPIIFQSIHIVWHHNHALQCEFHVPHQLSDKGLHENHQAFSEKESTCAICEYQLAINGLPKSTIYSIFIPTLTIKSKVIAPKLPHKIRFSNKSPRAPPAQLGQTHTYLKSYIYKKIDLSKVKC